MSVIERTRCIFCCSSDLVTILDSDLTIFQNIGMLEYNELDLESKTIKYNIQCCNKCNSFQNKYLAPLENVYSNSHVSPIGSIRSLMTDKFGSLILSNKNVNGIIEIGAGKGELSEFLLSQSDYKYNIIDPSYIGPVENRTIIASYIEDIEDIDINNIQANSLIISHVFEHFYEPLKILKIISNNKNLDFVYICHPNFDKYVSKNTLNILNIEHTFYIENDFLIKLFNRCGFKLIKKDLVEDYSILFEFKRTNTAVDLIFKNIHTVEKFEKYSYEIYNRVKYLNDFIDKTQKDIYIWPCSVHIITLFNFGLKYNKLVGSLDNSEYKIGKYMYGYKLKCFPFKEIVKSEKEIVIILNGGCFNKEIVDRNQNKNIQFI
jgi:hypothetical protein